MAWASVERTLFRATWPTWYRYRAFLLRLFGARVDPHSRIRRTCRFECPWNLTVGEGASTGEEVWFYCLGPVFVGRRVTLSHFCKLCAGSHDLDDPELMPLTRPPVVIHDDAWVATAAFVGPGVTVGEGAVLGAAAVTMRDLEPWSVYAGNPARLIRSRARSRSV